MAILAIIRITDVDVNPAAGGMRAICSVQSASGQFREDNVPAPYANVDNLTVTQINNGLKNYFKQYTIDHWGLVYNGDEIRLVHSVDLL